MTSSESAENNNDIELDDGNELKELRREVLALREIEKEQADTTASLLTELQRRCDHIIELEVRLDKERERANRLERERKEDEALSGELRELMANVDTLDGTTPEHSSVPPESDAISPTASFNETPPHPDASKRPTQQDEETKSTTRSAYGPLQGVGGLLADWGIPVGGRGHTSARAKGSGVGNSSGEGSGAPEKFPSTSMAEEASAGGGGSRASPGALRARVVELELQRAEAEELVKKRADQSLRLQVQVEQLKNVVQSLSHASSGWEGAGGRNGESSLSGKGDAGIVDLGPLLRDVPGVDPSVLLMLHRTPWAEDACEGIRKQEACFEWQGKDSRGIWSSKPSTLPSELSSLPYKPPQKPGLGQETPAVPLRLQGRSTFPSPQEKNASSYAGTPSMAATAADRTTPSSSERAVKRGAGFGERIGEAVSAFGGAGMWIGREDGGGIFTNESISARFSLRDVELWSDHWEWVGGWIPDAEEDASADEDGWIYGRTPSEIAEKSDIARSRGRSENVSEIAERVKNAQSEKEDGATRKSGEWSIHIPVGKESAETRRGVRGEGGMKNGWKGVGSSAGDGAAMVRRRRLVRLRTVVRLDGARESTNKFLETMRRVCSLEILVRKLSQQVVSLHRQVTGLEGQVAFLAPLQPKLRQACALGRKDRQRGEALQRRLIEAENELKVLKRCMGSSTTPLPPSQPNLFVSLPTDRNSKRDVSARASDEMRTAAPGGINNWYDGTGIDENDGKEKSAERQGSWGWVGGVAQRAAGNLSLSRRSFSLPVGGAFAGQESAKVDGEGGVEEKETGRLGKHTD